MNSKKVVQGVLILLLIWGTTYLFYVQNEVWTYPLPQVPGIIEAQCGPEAPPPTRTLKDGIYFYEFFTCKEGELFLVSRTPGEHGQPLSYYFILDDPLVARSMNENYIQGFVLPLQPSDSQCDDGDTDPGTLMEDEAYGGTGGAARGLSVCRDPAFFVADWYWVRGSYRAERAKRDFERATPVR